jgi:cysteinyl-tRNA synthetase
MLVVYNTLSRGKETFKPLKDKSVGLYSCGPTVYNYAHIGNLRYFIFVDTLKRTLKFDGYKVKHVMNITDVGHLTSDADLGEDKLEKGAKREGKTVWQVSEFYTRAFKKDLKALDVIPPDVLAKATEHIKEQINLIKRLEANGLAYQSPSAVYFDTSLSPGYGKLAGLKISGQMEGAGARDVGDVEIDSYKKHPTDFVLWFKRFGKYKDHVMHWPSPWGDGFPGWHIECSAMSMKYLGETFDIHTGGVDHIGVHHVNEIAQSEGATGKQFVKYWMHGAFLTVAGEAKMAKSGDNFITLDKVIERGFEPLSYRYLVLMSHYRSQLSFSWPSLAGADTARRNLEATVGRLKEATKSNKSVSKADKQAAKEYESRFEKAIDDDLNTPQALAVLWDMLHDTSLGLKTKEALTYKFDRIFGLELDKIKPVRIPEKVRKLIEERERFRTNKQFIQSDTLRQEIERLGYRLEDTADGLLITKK